MESGHREIDNLILVNPRDWSREIIEDDDFAYASSRVKAKEAFLLDRQEYDHLIYNDRVEADWIAWWARAFNSGDYEVHEGIRETLIHNANVSNKYFREVSGDSGLAEIFLSEYDYANAKVMLKTYILHVILGQPISERGSRNNTDLAELLKTDDNLFFAGGNLSIDVLADFIAGEIHGVPAEIVLPELYPKYLGMAISAIKQDIDNSETNQLASVDRNLDKARYRHFLEASEAPATAKYRESLYDYISIQADSSNLQSFFRARAKNLNPIEFQAEFVSGGTIAFSDYADLFLLSPEELEDADILTDHQSLIGDLIDIANEVSPEEFLEEFSYTRDNIIMRYANRSVGMIYGAEVLIGIWLARKNEITNLRIILVGHEQKIDKDRVESIMRNLYGRV